MKPRQLTPIALAVMGALPGIALRLLILIGAIDGHAVDPRLGALVSGDAILSASFLLLWACEAIQADIPQSLALAVLALVAVLPEYSVDMYLTWMAGKQPESNLPHLAIANMTGANRLLVGVAWGVIATLYWIRRRRGVRVEKERRTKLIFLGLATAYAFVIPMKGTLTLLDGAVFVGIYAWYLVLVGKHPQEEVEMKGVAETLSRLTKKQRLWATGGMFAFAGLTLLANSEPFCEGLIATGKILGIDEFYLIQWLAPIASESPEFIVAGAFAWRGRASMGLGSLISSELNQWTLLVGMIPLVFAISSGTLAPIPMGSGQMQEILLTAAQSLLAVVMLASMRLSISGAMLLFLMFAGQLVMPPLVGAHPWLGFGLKQEHIHPLFSAMYIVAAIAIFLQEPKHVFRLILGPRKKATHKKPPTPKAHAHAKKG